MARSRLGALPIRAVVVPPLLRVARAALTALWWAPAVGTLPPCRRGFCRTVARLLGMLGAPLLLGTHCGHRQQLLRVFAVSGLLFPGRVVFVWGLGVHNDQGKEREQSEISRR